MAEGNPNAANGVTVDTAKLRKSAGIFDSWGQWLLDSLAGIRGVSIAPGNFPAADNLKTRVDTCTRALTINVENLGNTFKDIGNRLNIVATEYDNAEDRNTEDAKRLDPLHAAVNKRFQDTPK
jgi:hypothetical protein